jgi:hypothetical protein
MFAICDDWELKVIIHHAGLKSATRKLLVESSTLSVMMWIFIP